jgi:Raf kinase inhibitor-like YbhB/YbcL family protein
MPEPGSHAYDVRRARLRGRIDDKGTPDRHATEEANRRLRGPVPAASESARTGRAAGPAGEAAGPRGDAGNVIPLRTRDFSDHAPMPARLAKDAGNAAPALEWADVPDGTEELALLCVDVDAPNGDFLHWLVTGIAPHVGAYDPADPVGHDWPNGYGERGYGGPLPPVGDDAHRYVFRLYALPEPFGAPPTADLGDIRAWLDDHALATGTLVGLYQR